MSSATRSDRKTRMALLVLAAVAGLALIAPPTARGADYLVVQCHNQHSLGAVFPSPFSSNGQRPKAANKCGPLDGGIGVYEEGGPAADGIWGQWAWSAPPTTYFTRIDYKEHTRADDGWLPYFTYDPYPSGAGQGHQAKRQNDWVQGYAVTNPARTFHVFLSCFGGCTDGGAHNFVKNLFFTVKDMGAPTLAIGGALLGPGPRHGAESLELDAGDSGSGIYGASVEVNDVPVWTRSYKQDCAISTTSTGTPLPYRLRPCPSTVSAAPLMQTDAPPWRNGSNRVVVCVSDYAGNESVCATRFVEVDNSCPSSGGQQAADLEGGIQRGGSVRPSASVRSTEDVVARGQLETAAGQPVDGATVCVFETAAIADATPQLVAKAQTRNGGRFAALVERGPSRKLRFVYRYNSLQLTDTAALRSTVVPSFRIGRETVRNGSTIRFSGRIPGPRAADRVVAIQVRFPKKWRTFKVPRTNPQGRFRAAYQFVGSSTFRYTFRAAVKRQHGYPYEPGRSAKRRVLVIG